MKMVDAADVYPYEDNDVRMNPRDVSSAECRAYIAQLAEQFKSNRLNPGQPRVRPILYQDGGIYWIIDGECRFEAMRSIGTKRFWADVYDDLDDAEEARREAAKAMVETDAKRALTPEELSRGVQTMLALDVPDEEVAAAARVDAGSVRRARRAAGAVGDAAYDMTLDRLVAIEEFAGDEEAVAQLRDCQAKDWRRVHEGLRAERARREAVARMAEAAGAAGVRVEEATPEGYKAVRTFSAFNEDRLGGYLEGVEPSGAVAVATGYGLTFMEPAGEDVGEAERREAQERADFMAAWDEASARRDRWVGERAGDASRMRATARMLTGRALEARAVRCFEERSGAKVASEPCALALALGWFSLMDLGRHAAWGLASGRGEYVVEDAARDFSELLGAMERDGYEPDERERAVADACRAALGGGGDER